MKNHVDEKNTPSYNGGVRKDMHLENHTFQSC